MQTLSATSQQILYTGCALLCSSVASIYDVRERRIPNRLTGPCLAAGLLLHFGLNGGTGLGSSLLAAVLAGAVFLLFFLAGGMGAGDVKLMAAVGAVTGLFSLQLVLLATVFTGALFALALAAYHGRLRRTLANVAGLIAHHGRQGLRPHPLMNLENRDTLRLPFAVPIAAGCLVAFGSQLIGPRP